MAVMQKECLGGYAEKAYHALNNSLEQEKQDAH